MQRLRKDSLTRPRIWAAGLFACGVSFAGWAIDAPDPESFVVLEEVVVTANRRPEPIGSVASSVSAITGQLVEELGARDLRSVMALVPGLAMPSGMDSKYILRGVSSDLREEYRPATGEYIDETPITNPGTTNFAFPSTPYLIDIDRVEVLRGPQGTLFGSSTLGGAVRYITRRPTVDRTEGWVELGGSSTTHGSPGYSGSGMFNLPLQDGVLALRGVGYYELQGGYIDNLEHDEADVNDHVLSGGRLALQWQPNDRLTVVARILLQRQANGAADLHELDDPYQSQSRVMDEVANATRFLANLDIDYEFDTATLHSTTSWNDDQAELHLDVTDWMIGALGIPVPARSETMRDTKDFTQEVRIESRDRERFDWLAGVFYQRRDNVYSQNFPAPGFDELFGGAAADFGYPDNLYASNVPTPGTELAAYGEMGWRPNKYWRVAAGARWYRMDRTEHEQADGFMNGGPTDRRAEATETGVSPRATLSYAPSPERTYYAVVSKGFRPGGPNLPLWGGWGICGAELEALGYDSQPLSYSSDELWNYEIGARQTLQEGRLSLAGTVYRIDWSRIQTMVYLPGCGAAFIQNAGDARNDGIEFELSYRVTAGLDLRLAASYVDARILQPAPGSINNPDDPLPGVPDLTGGLSATWQFYSGNAFSASLYGLWSYVGGRYTGSLSSVRQQMDAYDLLNLRLQLAGQRWSAALSADNVFDEDGVVNLWDDPSFRLEYTTRPRTLRLTVKYAF